MPKQKSALSAGNLVRFVPVETGVDLITADGTKRVDPISRLERDVYRTEAHELGIIIAGPYVWNSLTMWKVLIGGGEWFFESGHLVQVESRNA